MARILCIEDEAALRRIIADELRDAGLEVIEAGDGEEGLAAILHLRPDLVLCDVTMPGLSGYDVLGRLRSRCDALADIPFVFLSALADRKDVIAGRQLGADDYLTKPIDLDLLLATVETRLARVRRLEARVEAERAAAAVQARGQDGLTGLPTRAAFLATLATMLAAAPERLAVLFVEVDRFRQLEVALGADGAEDLLRQAADRLCAALPAGARVARHGAERFVLALPAPGRVVDAAEDLRRAMGAPFEVAGRKLFTTVSIGIAVHPDHGTEAAHLVTRAEEAAHAAAEEGGNACRVFRPEQAGKLLERLEIAHALRDALMAGEFELHYQPKVDLVTLAPIGAEALLRWTSPTLGRVAPAVFIPVAEETGLIVDIGTWVLREACRCMAEWRAAGFPDRFRIAVNVAAQQFRHPAFTATVGAVLAETALPPSALVLEITESALVDDDAAMIDTLRALRGMGVSLSIDDFGTGYSSLSYLGRLPADELKIDQSFVRGLPDTAGSQTIVNAVIAMGRDLGMRLVAEGVETEAHRLYLGDHGCEVGQGWLFAKPLPAEDFRAFILSALPASMPG